MTHPRLQDTLDALSKLISFETVSDQPNLPLIEWAAATLENAGLNVNIHPASEKGKANLTALIMPQGSTADAPPLMFSGHTDVVPVTDQQWNSDPFVMEIKDGKAYGRGAVDMKGFVALMMVYAPLFQQRANDLNRPVIFAFTHDEETDMSGAYGLCESLPTKPDTIVVGEPTGMKIVDGHKGVAILTTRVKGHSVHSSQPYKGINANLILSDIIQFLKKIAQEKAAAPIAGSRFIPPYTSMNIGTISGGSALNITAVGAHMQWEFRPEPNDATAMNIVESLNSYSKDLVEAYKVDDAAPEIETVVNVNLPPLAPTKDNTAREFCARLTGENQTEVAPYGTEGGVFQLGLKDQSGNQPGVVICGPGGIEMAHQANEYISLEQLEKGAHFMDKALEDLCQDISKPT